MEYGEFSQHGISRRSSRYAPPRGARRLEAVHERVGYTHRMDPKRTIAQLLAAIRADPTDARSRLRLGDLYAKLGDVPNALAMYEEVAYAAGR